MKSAKFWLPRHRKYASMSLVFPYHLWMLSRPDVTESERFVYFGDAAISPHHFCRNLRTRMQKVPPSQFRIATTNGQGNSPVIVLTGSNPSKCVQYIFFYFKSQTGHWVWSLPLPELITDLGSHLSRFWFEPEFGTKLQQHYWRGKGPQICWLCCHQWWSAYWLSTLPCGIFKQS